MRLFPNLILLMLLCLCSTSVLAQQPKLNCNDPQTQSAMNQCSYIEFQKADMEMNRVYRRVIAQLANPTPLRGAQRAWVDFRNKDCTALAAPNTGGSIVPLIINTCSTARTKERIKQLQEYINNN